MALKVRCLGCEGCSLERQGLARGAWLPGAWLFENKSALTGVVLRAFG